MDENKKKTIIILLIINAVLVCYFGFSIRKQLNRERDQLASHISNISSMVSSLESRISSNMQNILNEKDNMVKKAEYACTDIDADRKKVMADFTVDLKAVKANSDIYLSYRPQSDNNIQEVKLQKINGLSYGASIELHMDKNYEYDIIERVDGGGEALLNVNKQYAYLYDKFYQQRVQLHGTGTTQGGDELFSSCSFSVNHFGIDKFRIDKVFLKVFYNDKLIDSIDVTDRIISSSNGDLTAHYNAAIASGQISENMSIEEFAKNFYMHIPASDDDRDYYVYNHTIKYSDYPELKQYKDIMRPGVNVSTSGALQMDLVVICKDGWRHMRYGGVEYGVEYKY